MKILFLILLVFLSISKVRAQRIIIDTLSTENLIIEKEPIHLFGIEYGYAFTGVQIDDIGAEGIFTPLNLSLLYTYYHPLWGYMDYFGIQTGIKYGTQGFTVSKEQYKSMEQIITTIELPLLSAFKVDIGDHFRLLFGVGPFIGYRLKTSRENGFNCFDNRFDYGILGKGGFAIRISRFELHLQAYYQYSFSFIYHPEVLSSDRWLYSYPYQIGGTAGIHFKF